MLTFLLILLLVAVLFGLGTALEVAFWTLAIFAAVVLALVLGTRALLRRF
jgi:hypothetical protein